MRRCALAAGRALRCRTTAPAPTSAAPPRSPRERAQIPDDVIARILARRTALTAQRAMEHSLQLMFKARAAQPRAL
jgi:hypothetical protein